MQRSIRTTFVAEGPASAAFQVPSQQTIRRRERPGRGFSCTFITFRILDNISPAVNLASRPACPATRLQPLGARSTGQLVGAHRFPALSPFSDAIYSHLHITGTD